MYHVNRPTSIQKFCLFKSIACDPSDYAIAVDLEQPLKVISATRTSQGQ